MSKKLFGKFFILLLVVGLLFAAAPTKQALAQTLVVDPSIQAAADRVVELQRADGGWGWPLTYPDGTPSAANIVGPIGNGLAEAYLFTNDPDHLAALEKAGDFLLAKTTFSGTDYDFAMKLDEIFGVTTYTTYVKTNFYDKLAAGTYTGKSGGPYSTQTFIDAVRAGRSGNQANMAAWDMGILVVSAVNAGVDLTPWIAGLEAEINELYAGADKDNYMANDVIGLAGAVYGLAVAGVNFDPTAGEHAAADSTAGLAAILASYQIDGGGFAWNKWWVIPDDYDEAMQETSYAMLALSAFDRSTYAEQIDGAAQYARSIQLTNGGWYTDEYNDLEYVEVSAEVLWGVSEATTRLYLSPAITETTDTCTGTHEVFVNVENVANMAAYSLKLTYDADLITVTNVENVGFVGGTAEYENTFTDGTIKFGWSVYGGAGDPATINGDASLIKITFQSKGLAGTTAFTLDTTNSMLVDWPEVQPIPFSFTGGGSVSLGSIVTNISKDPQVSYCDLATAVSQATSGDTLRADVDFTVPTGIAVQKALTLNTNGKTITYNGGQTMLMTYGAGDLTVTGVGTLVTPNGTALGLMSFSALTTPKLSLQDATISGLRSVHIQGAGYLAAAPLPVLFSMTSGSTTDGIDIHGWGAEINMVGGTATCGSDVDLCPAPIFGRAAEWEQGTKVTIGGNAVVTSPSNIGPAIYQPQDGQIFITGGTISGLNGINMEAGKLTVSGTPSITGTGGDAILMNGNIEPFYASDLTANISGGEFTSTGGYALHETAPVAPRTSTISVTGGKFTGTAGSVSFGTVDPAFLMLTGGAYNTDPGGTPDYVFAPYATYLKTTDSYYYIEQVLTGRIDVLPGFNPPNLTWTADGTYIDFLGDIPWYPADLAAGRTQGNRVAVKISEPVDGYDPAVATLTIGTQTPWVWNDIRTTDGWVDVWQKIKTVPQETLMVLKWNNVSTQTFPVRVLTGSVLLPPPAPIISSTDIQGYYLAGETREFNVSMQNPANGANYALMIFDYKLAGVTTADITSFEYFAQDLGTWITMGSRAQETYDNCTDGTGVCGQFGWAPGGFGSVAAGFENTSTFRVNFNKGFSAPLVFTLDLSGKLATTDTAWTLLTTYTGNMNVYDKATVTVGNVDPYFLVSEPGAFSVTVNNPTTGRYYDNTVVFDVEITPPAGGGISALVCTSVAPLPVHTWTFDSSDFTIDPVSGKITARLGGEDDYFIVPNLGIDGVVNCTATFTKEGTYLTSGNMVDVVSTAPVVERIVSNAVSASAVVYRAPEISAVFPAGPYLAGVPVTIPVTITNPDGLTDPFELQVVLSDGTILTFAVDAATYPTTQNIVITFDTDQAGTVVLDLYDDSTVMNGRLLDTATQTDVVVNSGFTVTGNFSMQGNLSRSGIPVTFTWGSAFADYDETGTSTTASGTNLSVVLTYGGNYTITTNQARYLNVYADVSFSKIINVTGDRLLPELRLRGGNAIWTNNEIDLDDANQVGTDWGSIADPNGNVNFDGIVNIQDLALVGGNYGLTSAGAYGTTWVP